MSTESDDIRTQVTEILKAAGVTFSAIYLGQRKRDGWNCDAWSCAFTKGDGREAHEEFDYFTGLGLRKPPKWEYGAPGYDGGRKPPTPGTILHEQWMEGAKPVSPHPADVLHSLILDSSAVGQSFESWCSEFGYDSDSRKAEGIYRACQQSADKLACIFNPAQIETLQTTLEGY